MFQNGGLFEVTDFNRYVSSKGKVKVNPLKEAEGTKYNYEN